MKLHFLGTTGYHPNNSRQTACLMLPEAGIIFDAGTGMFRVRELIQTDTLDIFLSHVHLDHVVGLTFLYDILYEKPLSRVTVHLAEENIEVVRQQLYHPKLFPVKPNFELRPFPDSPMDLDGRGSISFIPLEHPGGCFGFCLNLGDRRMAYITDTVADENADYVQQIQDVDTLVHECYFPDGWEDKARLTGHSCLTPVAKVARAANAGQVYLVHVNPLDEAGSSLDLSSVAEIFEPIQIATDQMVVDLG